MSLAFYTGQVRGLTFGLNTTIPWEQPPAGLGLPTPDSSDQNRLGHGTVGGVDRARRRVIRVPLLLLDDTGALVEGQLDDLKEAWAYSDNDTTLDLRLAGGERRYFGRTRGLEINIDYMHQGAITGVVGEFHALDPWGYGAEATVSSSDGQLEITNAGNVPNPQQSRCVLTATGATTGGLIENLDDPDGLLMNFPTLAETVEIDLFTWTVVDTDGNNMDGELTTNSGWPVLVPGQNRFAYSGFSGLSATYRPPYL